MIGIFDSGVGGMTVARAIEQHFPDIPSLYLGDLARSPYGPKSDSAIIDYSLENGEFLINKGATLIVVACNSASSVATEALRAALGVPVVEVVTPAVDQVVHHSTSGRIGVIGTRATIRSNIYPRLLKERLPSCKVYSQACPLLVPLVEEGWFNTRETKMILRRYLHHLRDKQIDSLILGCTHYPLLKKLIQPRIGKKVHLVDSAQAVSVHLEDIIRNNPGLLPRHEAPERLHFVTDYTETAEQTANLIFQREIQLIQV